METILLVDDETNVRRLVRKILESSGYTILEASRGTEALQICQKYEGPVHLLVTDVIMPGMNGQSLTEQVTALRPHARVLYMSGCADSALLTLSARKTEIAFIQKPFTPDALARKVRDILDAAH